MTVDSAQRRLDRRRLKAPFAVREFRYMFAGEVLSVAGDQVARVALSVLVFAQTHSGLLTGLTYALTFAPALLGGALFGSLGDRYDRRTVLIASDCLRAGLMALAAVRGAPIWLLCVLVAATTLINGPFKGAQQALLPDVLPEALYTTGMTVRNIAIQSAQFTAFGLGGMLAAAIDPHTALLFDAGSFLLSACLLWTGVRARSPARTRHVRFVEAMRQGSALVFRDPALRSLIALLWLAAFYVVPEAVAAPYVATTGGGSTAVGLVMASDPAGSVIGGIVFGKWVSDRVGRRIIGPLGVLAGLPLVVMLLRPPLPVAMGLFALSGAAATGYTIHGVAEFMRRLPNEMRAQGSGILGAGIVTVQGLGTFAAGALSDGIGPAVTIGLAGLVGAAAAFPAAVAWSRNWDRPTPQISNSSGFAVVHDDPPFNETSSREDTGATDVGSSGQK